ncbi:MAG: TraB/GumN family protein [Gammaproteobacteria bacterium]|nr:TraB/GumN family protein [Gammaproteobacteria bacterium]
MRTRAWMLVTWLFCVVVPASAAEGMVFRVSGGGVPSSYLVGTMHIDDPRVMGLMARINPLIEHVDVVAIELIPDALTMVAVGAATMLPADQSLRNIIGEDSFDALRTVAQQRGLAAPMLDRLKPWAVAIMLSMPEAAGGRSLDTEIYLAGLARQRELVGLETAAEQIGLFDELPLARQALMLEEMIKNADELPQQLEELTRAFLDGDLDRIERLAHEHYSGMPPDLVAWFEKALIGDRNVRMLARSLDLFRQGRVLVAVGGLHLPGDSGLVAALRREGFGVEPVGSP